MSRYINRNLPTVSQEFTVIELAVGLGIGAGIYKLIKKLSSDASKTASKIPDEEDRQEYETAIERYNRLIETCENATVIKESVATRGEFFGDATDAAGTLNYLNNSVIKPIESFLNKTESLVEKLMKMSANRNSNAPTISKGAIEVDLQELMKIIRSSGKSISVNGFTVAVIGQDSESSIETGLNWSRADDAIVKCPNADQFQKLLILAGSLLKLVGRTAEDKVPPNFSNSYLSHDLLYISNLHEMLDSTLYALTGYLLASIGSSTDK